MHTITPFSCAGSRVILAEGVADGEERATAAAVIQADPFGAQVGFLKNTGIRIPRLISAAESFDADTALCAAALLSKDPAREAPTLSSNALKTPFRVQYSAANGVAELTLAAKACINLTGDCPSVIFGGCEYFILEQNEEIAPLPSPEELAAKSSCDTAALLAITGDAVMPQFCAKGKDYCSFSTGSAAIALAFFESEKERNYFKKTYRFPKGERRVEMKRFLSEAFDGTLRAEVREV